MKKVQPADFRKVKAYKLHTTRARRSAISELGYVACDVACEAYTCVVVLPSRVLRSQCAKSGQQRQLVLLRNTARSGHLNNPEPHFALIILLSIRRSLPRSKLVHISVYIFVISCRTGTTFCPSNVFLQVTRQRKS